MEGSPDNLALVSLNILNTLHPCDRSIAPEGGQLNILNTLHSCDRSKTPEGGQGGSQVKYIKYLASL